MKLYKYLSIAIVALLSLASCNKDGDLVTVGKSGPVTIEGSCIGVLDENNVGGLAMTLYWNDNTSALLPTNHDNVLVKNYAVKNYIQMSDNEDFTNADETEINDGVFESLFTNAKLNEVLGRLGFKPYISKKLYVRIAAKTGQNVEPQYSNTLSFDVTPFIIFMNVVDHSTWASTGMQLYSPDEDNVYYGFTRTTVGWQNVNVIAPDGTGYYTVPDCAFQITDSPDWAMWYPEFAGCYYTTVDLNKKEWSALYIPSLTIDGDIKGDMKLDPKTAKWTYVFEPSTTAAQHITLSCDEALLFDRNSRDNTSAATTMSVSLGNDIKIVTEGEKPVIEVQAPVTGKVCTLVADLSKPNKISYYIEEGGEMAHDILSAVGFNDNWDLISMTEIDNTYVYTCDVTATATNPWGAKLLINGSWDEFFGLKTDGTLALGSADNDCPAAADWVSGTTYTLVADAKNMKYLLTDTKISYAGFNDSWGPVEMHPTTTKGVYYAYVEATAATPWGVQLLINGSWDNYLGLQPDGTLTTGWKSNDAVTGDAWEIGNTYKLTIDTVNLTYTLVKQ